MILMFMFLYFGQAQILYQHVNQKFIQIIIIVLSILINQKIL